MKRSDMIKTIANDLKGMDQLSFNEDPLPMSTYLNDAESLLSKLEKLGMKPPSYQIWPRRSGAGGAVAGTRVDGQWENE